MNPSAVNSTAHTTSDTLVRTGKGVYYGISLRGDAAADFVSVYDGTDANGELIDAISVSAALVSEFHWFGPQGVKFNTGLFVTQAAAAGVGAIYHS